MPRHTIGPQHRSRAKALRREMTDAEARLWRELRSHRLGGLGFRRQVPLGPFTVDFACLAERLIVEVDGEHHASGNQLAHDFERDRWLQRQEFRVLRFSNRDVMVEIDAVCRTIPAAAGRPF